MCEYSGCTIHPSIEIDTLSPVICWYYTDPAALPAKYKGRTLPVCEPIWPVWGQPVPPVSVTYYLTMTAIVWTKGLNLYTNPRFSGIILL